MKRIPIEVPEGVSLPERDKRLSFTEWVEKHKRGKFIVSDFSEMDKMVDEYMSYLNNLPEEKASVIECYIDYNRNEFMVFNGDSLKGINRVIYDGRCAADGDLFTIHTEHGLITHAQGTLNGLFIEIPE